MKRLLASVLSLFCIFPLLGADVPADDFLVEVNGERLSVSNAQAEVALRIRLYKRTGANQKAIDDYANQLKQSVKQNFIRKAGLKAYAAANHLTNAPTAFAARCEKAAQHFGYKGYTEMKADLSAAEVMIFEETTLSELVAEVAEAHLRADIDDKVTEAEIDAAYEQLKTINATANATNRLVWAHATNIYERIHTGKLDFKDAVKLYSAGSGKNMGGFWRCMTKGEMVDEEPTFFRLFSEKERQVGELLPPVEADNGVMICKITGKEKDRWELSGVQLRLMVVWQHPERDQLRKTLESSKRSEALKAKYQKIASGLKVVFPKNPPEGRQSSRRPVRPVRPSGPGKNPLIKVKP